MGLTMKGFIPNFLGHGPIARSLPGGDKASQKAGPDGAQGKAWAVSSQLAFLFLEGWHHY